MAQWLTTTRLLWLMITLCSCFNPVTTAFAPSSHLRSSLTRSSFQGSLLVRTQSRRPSDAAKNRQSKTSLHMFLGNDGGILGVGAPEVVTILLVGYFVLGPSDLYKLTKEIGKGIQNFRTLSSDVTKTFENNMESQLQLEELRKAQRELNDAFSFRRSINVDEEADAFATTPETSSNSSASATNSSDSTDTTTTAAAPKRRKKRRRVKKKKVAPPEDRPAVVAEANGTPATATGGDSVPPDLEMPAPWDVEGPSEAEKRMTEQELELREARMKRLKQSGMSQDTSSEMTTTTTVQEQDRFVQQMSGDWNEQILANQDKLEPLAKVMERLAILEEEKNAADARLEEEFRLRTELEEKFYREKRAILEEAAAEVQAGAYASVEQQPAGGGEEKSKAA